VRDDCKDDSVGFCHTYSATLTGFLRLQDMGPWVLGFAVCWKWKNCMYVCHSDW